MARYVLGQMSPEEEARVEEKYFVDGEFLDRLLSVENELIDSYVRGELKGTRRQQFEEFYITSPERRQRVEIFRALMDRTVEEFTHSARAHTPAPRRWSLPYAISDCWTSLRASPLAFIGTTVVILCLGSIAWIQNHRLRLEFDRVQIEAANLRRQNDALQRQMATAMPASQEALVQGTDQRRAEAAAADPSSVSLTLSGVLNRDAHSHNTNTVVLPPPARQVVINLVVDSAGESHSYTAVVKRDNKVIEQFQNLRSHTDRKNHRVVTLHIPAGRLPADAYIVEVKGGTVPDSAETKEYSFQVVRR